MSIEQDALIRTEVRIETVEVDGERRQIGARQRITELLDDRRADIQSAIAQAAEVVQGAGAMLGDRGGWRVETVEAKFGVKLAAQAGVVLSKASSEASFEVSITVSRVVVSEQ